MLASLNNIKYNLNQLWKPFLTKSRLYIRQFYKTLTLIIGICTGYPFEIIVNAFTISSLIQIVIKLGFSLFFIELSIIVQISLLFLLIPVYIKYNVFDLFRTFLADFFWKYLPERSHAALDPDRDDEEYIDQGDRNDVWYNYLLLSFIHFFILIRMFLMSEPILSMILKFIAIRYFILNEYLFLAYTISLVFILSRFIFLLSDKTLGVWKASIREMVENEEEIPKITKKNILIMTHWSLRYVSFWNVAQSFRKSNVRIDTSLHLYDDLEDKFGFELKSDKIQTIPKNRYCIKVMFFISFFILFFIYYNKTIFFDCFFSFLLIFIGFNPRETKNKTYKRYYI